MFIGCSFAVLPFLSCSKKADLGTNPQDSTATITIISGNHQTGIEDHVLSDPIIIGVMDSHQNPIAGVTVRFEIVEGGSRLLEGSTIQTNADGQAENRWEIGASYNAVMVTLIEPELEASPCFFYSLGDNLTGMNETLTINSLEQIGDRVYEMTFFGDYTDMLETMDQRFRNYFEQNTVIDDFHCSLFSAFGDSNAALFGRSFDNPADWACLTLLVRTNPPDGYKSLALVRMRDFGYEPGVDFDNMTYEEKRRLLEAPFFPPDGINEHGVVAGLANVRPLPYDYDHGKKTIFITRLVREILDHARDVDEAADIARQHNVHCGSLLSLNVHTLVADPSGRSILLEISDGEIRVIPNTESWQVITNSPAYDVPIYTQMATCWRFDEVYSSLDRVQGNLDRNGAFSILQRVGNVYTEWSAVYDMTSKAMDVAIDFDFTNLYHFEFQEGSQP